MLRIFFTVLFSMLLAACCVQRGHCALRLGVLPAADSIVLHVAVDEGIFKAAGLDVRLTPFQSALELGAAMRANELDGHFGDIINVLMQHAGGAPQGIVAVTSRASQAQRCFGLVVSPSSKANNLAELKGKDVAISSASIIDFLLDALLKEAGESQDFLNKQDIRQIPVRLQMVMAGQMESALLPEPLVSLLEANGARTVLNDTGLNIPLAVIALRDTALAEPTMAETFRNALREAATRINADPIKYRARMVEKKLLPAPLAQTYPMTRFDMVHTPAGLPTQEEVAVYARWMRDKRMLRPEVDVNVLSQQVLAHEAGSR